MVQDHKLEAISHRSNHKLAKSREHLRLGILTETMNDSVMGRYDSFCYFLPSCYLEFKLCYLKNLKLFSIRVKELFEPIVLRKDIGDWFLLFLTVFS